MTSTTLIKQEEQSIPLHLYIASTSLSPELPHYNHSPLEKPTLIQNSFPFYPEVPLAKVVREKARYGHSPSFEPCELPPLYSNPFGPLFIENPISLTAASTTSSTLSTPSDSSAARSRIPRPPNAFMLFRSDFLKRGIIPSNVERRQQNLSRIVGEVWNMLDPAERRKWHERAAIALSDHQKKNPGYKFTPAPRGSRRNKTRGRADDKPDNIRDIREKYTNVMGPSPPSVRKRRQRKTRSFDIEKQTEKQTFIPPFFTAFHSKTSSFPPPSTKSHPVIGIEQSPASAPYRSLTPYYSMTTFPEPSIPRRPSTSLGFHPPPKRNHISYDTPDLRTSSTRPPAASSSYGFLDFVRAHGEELSLAINQFGSVSAPSSPPSYDSTMWTPYSTVSPAKDSGPIISGTIDSTEPQADLPSPASSSPYEPVDDLNPPTTAPADTASSESMGNYPPLDGVNTNTLLASLGFTDEIFASLTPSDESTSQMWLPSGPLKLEDWGLNVCPDYNSFSFTVGNL